MDKIFSVLLGVHIVSGGLSLLSGTAVLIAKKGNALHRRMGKMYFYSLFTACTVALPMCYLHPNLFLATVSTISLYMLLSGIRYLQLKDISGFRKSDKVCMVMMGLVSSFFAVWGLLLLLQQKYFGVVLLVLGGVALNFVRQDLRCLIGKYKRFGTVRHLQRMCGSYISSLTAFVVVNNTYLPGVVAWLLPAVIVSPFIFIWSRRQLK